MALIQKYKFEAIQLNHAKNYPALPLRFQDQMDVCYCLDAITAAVEAGNVDRDTWPSRLAASPFPCTKATLH